MAQRIECIERRQRLQCLQRLRDAARTAVVAAMVALAPSAGWAAADTLVQRAEDGTYRPAAAVSWKASADSVTFTLAEDVDADAVVHTLRERLAHATVAAQGNTIEIRGVKPAALLDQLSTLSLSGDADPLAMLAGLGGGGLGAGLPEGGGSIRASKPTTLFGGADAAAADTPTHAPNERWVAKVVNVEKGAYPIVALRIKVVQPPKAGPLKNHPTARKGEVLEALVTVARHAGGVDFAHPQTQRNAGAYYLQAGDVVTLHVASRQGEGWEIDWIERGAPADAASCH